VSEFDIMASAAAGLDAGRIALELAARNVAGAEVHAGPGTFARLVPRFAVAPASAADGDVPAPPDSFDAGDDDDAAPGGMPAPVRYLGAVAQPGSDVDAVTEMVAVLDAQRAYERNASVFDVGKRLAERTIDMGRLP